jgi:predicted HicB family RNase H-like nuclease
MTDINLTSTDEPLAGQETVELRLDREELYQLMLYAHERDITLNQLVEQILKDYIKEYQNENLDQ